MRSTHPVSTYNMAHSELIKVRFDKHGYLVCDTAELAPRGIDAKRMVAFDKLRRD